MNIILEVVKENELASIGFLGSEKFSNKDNIKEGKSNTQRFRIYKYITNNYFGLEKYLHYSNQDCSAYLLVSRNNQNPSQILESAINMFKLLYPELIDLTDIKLSSVG